MSFAPHFFVEDMLYTCWMGRSSRRTDSPYEILRSACGARIVPYVVIPLSLERGVPLLDDGMHVSSSVFTS